MGITKSELYTKRQNALAAMAKALAHPARIAILQELLKTQSCVCGSLVDTVGLAQPTISQHLKELRDAGLIKGEIEAPKVRYCINKENWDIARRLFSDLFDCFNGDGLIC